MKFLFAPDSFKGTLSSYEIISILENKAKEYFPDVETVSVPIADGGEGTIDAILHMLKGERKKVNVNNPLFNEIEAEYGVLKDGTAIIEMSSASGITLIPHKKGNALNTTTYGTGELIKDALERGYNNIYITIGGSATNDGGVGAMSALGVKFLDKNDEEIKPIGKNLINIEKIDISSIHPKIKNTKFTVMCDVNNTFTGENGATYVYGRQKGASKQQLDGLEKGMLHLADLIYKTFNININDYPGTGAAGGLGGALLVFLNAKLQSGIETVLNLIEFDKLIENVSLIITGEGRIDSQSACGKVLYGIGMRAKEKGIPVIAVTGGMGSGAENIYNCGIETIIPIVNAPMTLENALKNSNDLLESAVERMYKCLKIGMNM